MRIRSDFGQMTRMRSYVKSSPAPAVGQQQTRSSWTAPAVMAANAFLANTLAYCQRHLTLLRVRWFLHPKFMNLRWRAYESLASSAASSVTFPSPASHRGRRSAASFTTTVRPTAPRTPGPSTSVSRSASRSPFSQRLPRCQGLNFAAWLLPGDVLQSVEVSITSRSLAAPPTSTRTVRLSPRATAPATSTVTTSATNRVPFAVQRSNAGTYWLNLQNAQVNTGDPVYWDENSGRSRRRRTALGTIPSESFTVAGGPYPGGEMLSQTCCGHRHNS